MAKLFGTDGVRGVANRDLTPELAYKLGRAGACVLAGRGEAKKVVIGRDTRISGDMLEAAMVAGICSVGVDVYQVGVMPTPAIAYLTRELGAAAGVVISASHNPVEDNGIKFFGPSGYKLTDRVEEQIESMVLDDSLTYPAPVGGQLGRVYKIDNAVDRYVNFARSTVDVNLKGLKIVVDCANGAAYQAAPRVFSQLGAEVIPIFNTPDGVNINDGCGSTHPEELMKKVVEYGADLGLAHDGDADRVLAVDSSGRLVDGDQIMVICAKHLKSKGKLPGNTLVVTVMSNLGLHTALKQSGINVLETKVGDRYVMEKLLESGAVLGGEQSGHIIFLDHNTTGDGIITALQLLAVVKETGQSLDELAKQMERYPQLLKNVRVKDKEAVMNSSRLTEAVTGAEKYLQGEGRVLVRPSGTEPLVRVMAEAKDTKKLNEVVDKLVAVIERLN
ncbi:phosphoglucosamine mutase [Desulfohalotomaculum tongense]|uniref:phosphoglucosamine mutase n=1 Tax=Desulforadius tongensis TaxID=1216062 RepID=UPI0019579380|nr:phosphoglucosamine mutase [Desulforadius tongensis]MBM7853895.1 phosphoglucosamine mutase [Desulforadius tongensis]